MWAPQRVLLSPSEWLLAHAPPHSLLRTFTTSYTGSLGRDAGGPAGGVADAGKHDTPRDSGLPAWAPTQEQMNPGLLMSRDPILYFAEIPLYESELEDHGASQLSVKVRMPWLCIPLGRCFTGVKINR